MIYIPEKYRPSPSYATYPPYHKGLYLEDYFYRYYLNLSKSINRLFIPVSWTTCYIENKTYGLQETLDGLDRNSSYFTVSQHDDAIKERLPQDTLKFCAGGNNGGIPIPLVCSKIPQEDIKLYKTNKRDLLCSFVGSNTHPIRESLYKNLKNKPMTSIRLHEWSLSVHRSHYESYIYDALRSKFLLCPRGYGLNSFRLYESFQLGCVPVVITDQKFLPWTDELDWNSFAIITADTKYLYDILISINNETYERMILTGKKIYDEYFTLDGVCEQIIKRVNKPDHPLTNGSGVIQ